MPATMAPELREQLEATLAKLKPASIRVTVAGEDTPKCIKPVGVKGRWPRMIAAIPANAERIELCDAKGNVLDGFDVAEDDDDDDVGGLTGKPAIFAKLMSVALRAQDRAVERYLDNDRTAFTELTKMCELMMRRLEQQESMLADCIKVVYETNVMAGKVAGSTQPSPEEQQKTMLVNMALQKFASSFGPGAAPSKPNGTAPHRPNGARPNGAKK